MSNSSILPIGSSLSGATILARVDMGVMVIKGLSAIPKAPALQEPQHQIV